jgi:selenocysteine lyase/cysteine desulfurase
LGVVPINLNGKTSAELSEYLDSKGICVRGGLHCAPLFHQRMNTVQIGMVRLSFGIYNNENEIDYLVNMLKKII